MEIKLGQLFILRRDLKNEINSFFSTMLENSSFKEGEEDITEEYNTAKADWVSAREKLIKYDLAINKANDSTMVSFNDQSYSLEDARHLKVHIQAEVSALSSMLMRISRVPKTFKESVWELIDTPEGKKNVPQIKEIKNNILPDKKELQKQIKQLNENVQQLDSLIQAADWSTTVEV